MKEKKRFMPMSEFALAFAKEYKGWMSSQGIKQSDIAHELERTEAYVSERVSGKRPLDTLDVSALAELTHIAPRDLMIELAQRTRSRLKRTTANVNADVTEEEAMAQRILAKHQQNKFTTAAFEDTNKEVESEYIADEGA